MALPYEIGKEEGREEERLEERKENELLFLGLLRAKFVDVPANYYERIQLADSKTLCYWIGRIIRAETLTEVFDN